MTIAIIDQSASADKPELIWGAVAIGKAINEPNTQRVFYRLEQGLIPGARKVGRRWALSLPAFRRALHGEAA